MSPIIGDTNIHTEILTAFSNFEQRNSDNNENALYTVRQESIKSFEKLGLPTIKNEEYKYTSISKVLQKSFNFNAVPRETTLTDQEIESVYLKNLHSNILVFINGHFSKEHSKVISPEDELTFMTFSDVQQKYPQLLTSHFAHYASYEKDAFTALNTAFADNGTVIIVPGKTVVSAPVSLYFINDTSIAHKAVIQPRNLFLVGANSEVNFIESFHSFGPDPSFVNIVTEIVLEKNSKVKYTKINNESDKAYHVGTTQAYQTEKSIFTSNTVTFGGAIVRNNLNIEIDGEYAEANMYGLYLLNGKQHVDNHTMVDHKKPNCVSNELYKGIIDGKATAVFNGKIYVRQIAQKTNAFQSNRNILLSNDAIINTKPQLEIWADDVKCSHGATTGEIDDEQLFYLRSRGLSLESARSMLLYAFATDVFENVKLEGLKNYLDQIISERLRKDF
ncbi:MAG: Fe-S cluster assembly protein SufD [Bacteroidota bacterium]|nr:Fe-S cluster assembly protein SufD [Bacteroidota bacterium]